jgi:hypothetical protein
MNLNKYLRLVQSVNQQKGIKLTDKVLQAYKNPKYFYKFLLNEVSDKQIQENLTVISLDLKQVVNTRVRKNLNINLNKKSSQKKPTYTEVIDVIEKRFCSLPPFCRTNIYRTKTKGEINNE